MYNHIKSILTYDLEAIIFVLAGLISSDNWAAAIERVLHLDLPWHFLHAQLVSNTTDGLLDYHAWFCDLALKKPGCEVKNVFHFIKKGSSELLIDCLLFTLQKSTLNRL